MVSGKEYLVTKCRTNSGKQKLYMCVLIVLVYHIWSERNQRRMQGKQGIVEAIIKQCQVILAWCS